MLQESCCGKCSRRPGWGPVRVEARSGLGPIWAHMDPHGPIYDMGPYGPIYGPILAYGSSWTGLGDSVNFPYYGKTFGPISHVSGTKIRRALAQSVSDHRPLERNHKKKTSAMTCLFCFRIHQKMNISSDMKSKNSPFQEKGSEMDSEMSSCSRFLLR